MTVGLWVQELSQKFVPRAGSALPAPAQTPRQAAAPSAGAGPAVTAAGGLRPIQQRPLLGQLADDRGFPFLLVDVDVPVRDVHVWVSRAWGGGDRPTESVAVMGVAAWCPT